MSDWKRIAPITHAETDGPGRRFVWGLVVLLICIPLTMLAMRKWAFPIVEKKQAEQRAAAAGPGTGQLHTISLDIHGMECAMCAVHIEEVIAKVPGVKSVKADFETGKTEVICQAPDTAQLSAAIAGAVATTKYTIGPPPESTPAEGAPTDSTTSGSPKPENAEPTPNTP